IAAIAINYMYTATPKASVKLQTFYSLADSNFVENVELVNRSRVDFKLTKEGVEFIQAHKDKFKVINEALEKEQRLNPGGSPEFQIVIPDASTFVANVEKINEKNKAAG